MTGVLIKRGNLDTESYAQREYNVKRHEEKTAIYKPRWKGSKDVNSADTLVSDLSFQKVRE